MKRNWKKLCSLGMAFAVLVSQPKMVFAEESLTADEWGNASDVVINEIESNGDATDWVEIYNKGNAPVDISGWYITDDDTSRLEKNKTTPLPEGTILQPGTFFVFDQHVNFEFGLGAPDEVNLFTQEQELVEKYSWSAHAQGTYARIPDGTGALTDTSISTKGTANETEESTKPVFPDAKPWPGSDNVVTYDENVTMFQSDSSGLDFYQGQLYCINNKKSTFWVLDVHQDGSMDYADGFTAEGKNLAFWADRENPKSSNPDAEGITIDGEGNAYAAAERDNNHKEVNYNVILQFDPWEEKSTVVASREWNLTELLPDVPANAGIEAVEWISNGELEGVLIDQNTGEAFEAKDYPNAVAEGLFFVALEKNGHVYALALNEDATAQVIAEIDSGIGGAMALDYDSYEKVLWVGADDGYGNISAKITFNGTDTPSVELINPPKEMDVTRNNEGFAIAEPEYTVNGLRPVYHFMDGVNSGVLTISYLNCDYQEAKVVRAAGADRVETSLKAAELMRNELKTGTFDTILLASAENFPDALAGSYLASEKQAPILLTKAGAEAKVNAYIKEHLSENGTVYVLGGESAVSDQLLSGLTNVKRLFGTSRYETNLEILKEAGLNEGQELLICTGKTFADSLSASSSGLPILLTGERLSEKQIEFLKNTSGKFVIVGGTAAVNEAIEAKLAQLGTVERISGTDRYDTSVKMAEYLGKSSEKVVLASGVKFPDGLCGGPLADTLNAALILTKDNGVQAAKDYVSEGAKGIVLGGEEALSDQTVREIFRLTADTEIPVK